MDKLFEIDTYKGCRIECMDQNTILVRNGNLTGPGLHLRFEKVINFWAVELHISACSPTGQWRVLWAGLPLSDHQKNLWSALQYEFFRREIDEHHKFIEDTLAILRGA